MGEGSSHAQLLIFARILIYSGYIFGIFRIFIQILVILRYLCDIWILFGILAIASNIIHHYIQALVRIQFHQFYQVAIFPAMTTIPYILFVIASLCPILALLIFLYLLLWFHNFHDIHRGIFFEFYFDISYGIQDQTSYFLLILLLR